MEYKHLQLYPGEKTCCDECHRTFRPGEIVDSTRDDLVFCYSGANHHSCRSAYISRTKVWTTGGPARYMTFCIPAPFTQRLRLKFL